MNNISTKHPCRHPCGPYDLTETFYDLWLQAVAVAAVAATAAAATAAVAAATVVVAAPTAVVATAATKEINNLSQSRVQCVEDVLGYGIYQRVRPGSGLKDPALLKRAR